MPEDEELKVKTKLFKIMRLEQIFLSYHTSRNLVSLEFRSIFKL